MDIVRKEYDAIESGKYVENILVIIPTLHRMITIQ